MWFPVKVYRPSQHEGMNFLKNVVFLKCGELKWCSKLWKETESWNAKSSKSGSVRRHCIMLVATQANIHSAYNKVNRARLLSYVNLH